MKVSAIIEIPEGSNKKFEVKDGIVTTDRVLDRTLPVNYGFIPNTLSEDGDPLDIFVLSDKLLNTLDQEEVKVIGIFECMDQEVHDNKVFAILADEKFDDLTIWRNLAAVGDFLMNYKEGFKVLGYNSVKDLTFLEKYKV